jgi:hypothetical protein
MLSNMFGSPHERWVAWVGILPHLVWLLVGLSFGSSSAKIPYLTAHKRPVLVTLYKILESLSGLAIQLHPIILKI